MPAIKNEYDKYKNRLSGLCIRIIETGELFDTRQKCAKAIGISPSCVTNHLSGKTETCGGYHLEVIEGNIDYPLTKDIADTLCNMIGFYTEWREHPYIPNTYVSPDGFIAKNKRGVLCIANEYDHNQGYFTVSVGDYRLRGSKNNNIKLAHVLVAETYIPNPDDKPYVNHKDGIKINNQVDNLEWSTTSENAIHAYETGLHKTERVMIVETGEIFRSAAECARAIGGTACGICDCKNGRQRRHRGYTFEFYDNEDDFEFYKTHHRFYGIICIDTYTDEEAYFEDIQESCAVLSVTREYVVGSLLCTNDCNGRYRFEYAGREEVLLYGDESDKLLSWIRLGIR